MANTSEDTVRDIAAQCDELPGELNGKDLAGYAQVMYEFALEVLSLQKNCECCGNPNSPPPPPPPSA